MICTNLWPANFFIPSGLAASGGPPFIPGDSRSAPPQFFDPFGRGMCLDLFSIPRKIERATSPSVPSPHHPLFTPACHNPAQSQNQANHGSDIFHSQSLLLPLYLLPFTFALPGPLDNPCIIDIESQTNVSIQIPYSICANLREAVAKNTFSVQAPTALIQFISLCLRAG